MPRSTGDTPALLTNLVPLAVVSRKEKQAWHDSLVPSNMPVMQWAP